MPRILTIYNCGTASNRDKGTALEKQQAGELIAYLYDQTAAEDITNYGRLDLSNYTYKLIHDGPGSAPGEFGRWQRNDKGVREFTRHAASESQAQTPGLRPGAGPLGKVVQVIGGLAAGAGWEANVAHAVQVVKALEHRPDAINMAGWSRGGVTCHMIANALYEDASLRGIPVHIFAVDPVPGGWGHGAAQLGVKENVRHYRGVFARHDRKIAFRPAVVKPHSASGRFEFHWFPGVHDTLVQGAPGLHAVAVLIEHLAAEFLEMHGTRFARRIKLTDLEICENYAIANKTWSEYEQLASKGVLNKLLGLGGRAPARQDAPAGMLPACFVNDHHRKAFAAAFPNAHHLVFVEPLGRRKTLKPKEGAMMKQGTHELAMMKAQCRNTFQQLMDYMDTPAAAPASSTAKPAS